MHQIENGRPEPRQESPDAHGATKAAPPASIPDDYVNPFRDDLDTVAKRTEYLKNHTRHALRTRYDLDATPDRKNATEADLSALALKPAASLLQVCETHRSRALCHAAKHECRESVRLVLEAEYIAEAVRRLLAYDLRVEDTMTKLRHAIVDAIDAADKKIDDARHAVQVGIAGFDDFDGERDQVPPLFTD